MKNPKPIERVDFEKVLRELKSVEVESTPGVAREREPGIIYKAEEVPPPGPLEKAERLGIPRLYWRARLDDFPAEVTDQIDRPKNLLLLGGNGTGKTHLAAALALEWLAKYHQALKAMIRIRASFHSRQTTELQIIESLTDPRVLILDDLFAPVSSDFWLSSALAIIDERITSCKPTVVTTDRTLQQIDALDTSLASRLAGFKRITLTGEDRRL